ncbi:hypothetical protein DdX_13185 [Ditylenchus destructor]|uniref:Uncharacterized protein n=1 Tax=Ditylenchus destructor TaxID=166010 RepID=A0AAD4MV11_9BILA|nr:hypothetical protein DdX_13185 [Ditylenchus destructor]
MTPQASEILNGSKMHQMDQNLGNGFGEMTPELLAQTDDSRPNSQNERSIWMSSGDNSTSISPNGQQMNPASSSAGNSALSQAFNANNSNSGSDFASLNLNLKGGGAR